MIGVPGRDGRNYYRQHLNTSSAPAENPSRFLRIEAKSAGVLLQYPSMRKLYEYFWKVTYEMAMNFIPKIHYPSFILPEFDS